MIRAPRRWTLVNCGCYHERDFYDLELLSRSSAWLSTVTLMLETVTLATTGFLFAVWNTGSLRWLYSRNPFRNEDLCRDHNLIITIRFYIHDLYVQAGRMSTSCDPAVGRLVLVTQVSLSCVGCFCANHYHIIPCNTTIIASGRYLLFVVRATCVGVLLRHERGSISWGISYIHLGNIN